MLRPPKSVQGGLEKSKSGTFKNTEIEKKITKIY